MGRLIHQIPSNSLFDRLDKVWNLTVIDENDHSDIIESEEQYIIQIECAGIPKENLMVEITPDNFLQVSGRMSQEFLHEDETYKVKKLSKQSFKRVYSLPEGINEEPEAVLKDGILRLTWKKVKQKSNTIKVKLE